MRERIKQARKARNYTQKALADKIGISDAALSKIESGVNNPARSTLMSIASALNVSLAWLETGEGEMFLPQPQDDQALVDRLVRAYHGSPVLRNILTAYLQLDEPHRRVADEVLESFAAAVQSAREENAPEPDVDAWLAQVTLDPPPDAKAQ